MHKKLEADQSKDEDLLAEGSFIEVNLEEFSVYRPHRSFQYALRGNLKDEKALANEFAALNEKSANGEKHWLFDGIVRYGDTRRYLQHIPFDILSIGGYEDLKLHTVSSEIWIQSVRAQKVNVWYRLKSPAPEYARYYKPFLWLADFAKHTIDYLNQHQNVSLYNFKSQFYRWLEKVHSCDGSFREWFRQYNNTNFCRAISCHCMFIYDQFRNLQLNTKYESHPVWGEIDWVDFKAVPSQIQNTELCQDSNDGQVTPIPRNEMKPRKTIVTPYVFSCFEHLPWAKFLEPTPLAPTVFHIRHQKQVMLDHSSHLEGLGKSQLRRDVSTERWSNKMDISCGDIISIRPDKVTEWKSSDDLWYGYVQGIRNLNKGQALDLIWLYRPSDTACQKMKYPHSQELFLSDHCNCSDHNTYVSEIVSRHTVSFSASLSPDAEFFIRQKYVVDESAWVSLKASDFRCKCKDDEAPRQFGIGETLLVAINQVLEPVELSGISPDGRQGSLQVRRLLRRGRDFMDDDAEPNELVYTEDFEVLDIKNIQRPCHVRFYTNEEKEQNRIPAQYRRGGTADFFYILCQKSPTLPTILLPISKPWPPSLRQGWDPSRPATQQIMRGLDIFCGGGNLGRGLEEGGAVRFDWAVDYFKEAIHTYKANLKDPDRTKLYCGSVNDYLSQAMGGSRDELIASVGDVEVVSAGSPCQGFSNANHRKWNDQALLNISMVTSVVSFVDFYRPKYALLENVTGMAKCGTKDEDNNVFAQVLCALVGIGYQVRPYILDAWNFGSPQCRTRLFISITAPGLRPLSAPPHSHSHPDNLQSRSLGKTASGLPFGIRQWNLTPFEYVTIEEATKDLPTNYDGRTDCIPFPDHRPSRNLTTINRIRVSYIPRFPFGMNFVKASMLGRMPPPQMELYNWNAERRNHPEARSWKRVIPNALISTVTTACQPEDGICGTWIHWDACRCMTVMEVRRAQGFPDNEVIVGGRSAQWKIIGNSVARTVALALGMALRNAWLANGECALPVPQPKSPLVQKVARPCSSKAPMDDIPPTNDYQGLQSTATLPLTQSTSPNSHIPPPSDASDTLNDDLIYVANHKKSPSPSSRVTDSKAPSPRKRPIDSFDNEHNESSRIKRQKRWEGRLSGV